MVHTLREGNCGTIPERLLVIDVQPAAVEAPCSGKISYSENNCKVTVQAKCPEDSMGPGFVSESVLSGEWSRDASSGTALMSVTVMRPNGTMDCRGSYDIRYTRK